MTTKKLIAHIEAIQRKTPTILLCRFILNQATRTNNNKEALIRIQQLPFPVLSSSIKNKVVFKRAYEMGKGVVELKENGMGDIYREVCELIRKVRSLELLKAF